jgi:pyruvate,water dikinase
VIIRLVDAVPETSGGKAGALGALLRAGLPVPDGFVVPFAVYRAVARDLDLGELVREPVGVEVARSAIGAHPLPAHLLEALRSRLEALGDPPVAVRSSAGNEDTARTSAAGQHATALAVHGADEVARAVRACWASLFSPGAHAYREASGDGGARDEPVMAVLVQRHVDAAVSGVMFTSGDAAGGTEIEASWGLGPSVVGGTVSPDSFRVAPDGKVSRVLGDKRTRLDRHGDELVTRDVPALERSLPTLDDATVARLARLGQRITAVLGEAQDVEWAIADGRLWVLQARPVTVEPPPARPARSPTGTPLDPPGTLTGTPGSRGTATGTARVVRGPDDFGLVRPGDILVCPWTDPGWTPLLRIVAGVVTETGGALSHAAIVAREQRIPAVLGVPDATTRLDDAATLTVDGSAGTVTRHP